MSAMQEAFARVGINGYGARQVGRQLRPRPPVDPSVPPENHGLSTTRARVLEAMAQIEAMSDGELGVEIIALTENAEAIRIELRGVVVEPHLHEVGWQRRAERALVGLKGRLTLCTKEQERRAAVRRAANDGAKLERREAHERLLAEHRAIAEVRRERQEAQQAMKEANDALAFVRHARAILDHDTEVMIWEAVNAERGA